MAGISSYFDLVTFSPSWIRFYDDFFSTLSTLSYSTVKDAGASAAISTNAQNGTLLLSSAATTDNDGALVQLIQDFILPTSGKVIYLETKVKLSDATQTDFFFGMAAKSATNPEDILSSASRIGFEKLDGTAVLSAVTTATSVSTTSSCQQSMVDATYVTLSIYYDGISSVYYYVNGSQTNALTTNIPAAVMSVGMFHLSGDASGTKTSTWDYISLALQR